MVHHHEAIDQVERTGSRLRGADLPVRTWESRVRWGGSGLAGHAKFRRHGGLSWIALLGSCSVSPPSEKSVENNRPVVSALRDGGSNATSGSSGDSNGRGETSTLAPRVGGASPVIYWLDVGGKVLRSAADEFAVETVVARAGDGPDGIAIDVEGGHLYWTNMGVPAENDGSISRANLDGSEVTTVVELGETFTPKQLEFVPEQRKLYWADREGMRVMRSNLDGSELETLYQSGVTDTERMDSSRWCVGIAVDVAGGYFYWSQKGSDQGQEGSVRRARLTLADGETAANRSDVEVLFEGEAATCDIDLDLDAGFVYWANRGDDTVNRGPIPGVTLSLADARARRETVVRRVDQAIGVFLDLPRGLVYYTDAVGDLGRAGLDGSDATWLVRDAGAFTGIVVVDVALGR